MEIYAVEILDISEDMLNKLYSLTDSKKISKVKKFINKKDKIRTLIGEILIRIIITENLGIRNDNISFEKNPYGKPYIKEYTQFNFNISHSGDFVVCAIDNNPIGVDIEEVKYIEYEDIAKNFFTKNEFDYITRNDSYSSVSRFYEIWTLKESFIKCCGQGLSMPLKSFSIDIDEYKNIRVVTDGKHKDYIFKSVNMESNYKIAICSLSKDISDNITIIDQDCLINRYLDQA
ncbi:4'-phosphopantetheinyl transferase superfamily protein [Clostridium sp.]|uniref:4'-phosphopantetheinyl transferase family protein n=1 Tax=Clostridium sp. TaxID=1506 RepID=UPI00321623DB